MIDRVKNTARLIGGVIVGYTLAVLVAATVSVLCIFIAISIMSEGRGPTINDFSSAVGGAIVLTGMFAWPGFLATLLAAKYFGRRSGFYFSLCGVLTAILALVMFSGLRMDALQIGTMWYAWIGGAAGGFAYAWFHNRVFSWP